MFPSQEDFGSLSARVERIEAHVNVSVASMSEHLERLVGVELRGVEIFDAVEALGSAWSAASLETMARFERLEAVLVEIAARVPAVIADISRERGDALDEQIADLGRGLERLRAFEQNLLELSAIAAAAPTSESLQGTMSQLRDEVVSRLDDAVSAVRTRTQQETSEIRSLIVSKRAETESMGLQLGRLAEVVVEEEARRHRFECALDVRFEAHLADISRECSDAKAIAAETRAELNNAMVLLQRLHETHAKLEATRWKEPSKTVFPSELQDPNFGTVADVGSPNSLTSGAAQSVKAATKSTPGHNAPIEESVKEDEEACKEEGEKESK